MLVYLDQNKWIQLAQIVYGKDKSPKSIQTLNEIRASLECGYVYPLSATHYQEFSRISNLGRRKRLGQVMWDYSQNKTIVSTEKIVIHEIETALSKYFPSIQPGKLELIGQGMANAFGREFDESSSLSEYVDKVLLTGSELLNIEPIQHYDEKYRKNFQAHLNNLKHIKNQVPREKLEDLIEFIVFKDISNPLTKVMMSHSVSSDFFSSLPSSELSKILQHMPSRYLDVHLHRQVIRNENYNAKLSDLEDWAGLGVAVSYCDIVVCEKHFADMLRRDKHNTRARVVTSLNDIFTGVNVP
ncbi:hypothetical protein IB289_24275 [Vibrio parahaemolyticus]|uniref:hypothetical protein n=1 Tax=Vibrio parahaemolyticus TaxID=670 RepID=UPI001D16F315|nr:hypothetical protein [Vibrio parahaemolyticus]MCC3859461.1 hypothetical protein [Vibrio parahaemolyticus]